MTIDWGSTWAYLVAGFLLGPFAIIRGWAFLREWF